MQVLIYSFSGDLVTSGPYSQTATVAGAKQPVWGLESPTSLWSPSTVFLTQSLCQWSFITLLSLLFFLV